MKIRAITLLIVLVAISAEARADGKFFAGDRVPPDLPYQRALLRFDGSEETLLLQSKYEAEAAVEFGWVVPVPAVPQVGSVEPMVADDVFRGLARTTAPRVVSFGPAVWGTVAITALVLIVVTLLQIATGFPKQLNSHRRLLAVASLAMLVLAFLMAFTMFSMGASAPLGAEVVASGSVGVYDYAVVRADEGGGLVAWLEAAGFETTDADRAAIDAHVEKGWCFVAARISPERTEGRAVEFRGLVAPLILRFPTEEPVYPLALTAAAGTETEVVLYVLSDERLDDGGRLETRYAWRSRSDDAWDRWLARLRKKVEPTGFLGEKPFPERWLLKLTGRLTPEEMREDLVLRPAPDAGEHRETRWRW